MTDKRFRAVALAVALVVWSFTAGVRVRFRRHPLLQAAVSAGLAALVRAPLGLRPPALGVGLRLGAPAAALVSAGVAATTVIPAVRSAMDDRELPDSPWRWLALQIPVGTVWSEEAAFRGALGHLGMQAFGPLGGRLLQAVAFGLWHIVDARRAGQSVAGTVVVTGVAGWLFGWLAWRSRSVAAPMLVHLAINEAGAVAALAVQRRNRVPGRI